MITKNINGNNISSGFISQIQSDSPNVIARLWHNNSELLCDIVDITVEKGSCGQQNFMVGDVIGDMLTATVKDLSTDIKGELIECHIGALVNGSYEYISLGRFRVSEVKKTRYESQITAYSSIVADTGTRLDVTGLNNPTIAQIASKVAGKLNCTVTFDTGINTSYQVGAQLDGLTYYQALQVIAICCGGYVVNTNDGNVRVHRFSTTTNLNVNTGMMVKLPEIAEQPYKVETVGVLVSEATTDNNGNPVDEIFYSYNPDYIIVTKQGTDYYLKARSGQLILANLKPESADIYFSCQYMTEQMFKNNILSIRGYEYYPATIGLTLGDPRLEGCDVLNVTDVDGNTYAVPCHKVVHKYTGGFTSEITSCEASDKANSVGTSFPITQRFETQARQIGTAQATADNAYRIAGDTNQYFWFTGSGSDTGAHITETPQAQFVANPQNGGGNLLARSNGVAIRDGLTELAIFSANQLRIGRLGAQRAMVNSGSMELYNNEGDKYFEVSPDGISWGAGNNVASTDYVDDAEADAISTASADATSKANTAQANAISTASADATAKANTAQANAISTASADATAKANTAQANAEDFTKNFITTDSTGIKVHAVGGATAGNYSHIGSGGMDVYQGGDLSASFGSNYVQVGKNSGYNMYTDSSGIAFRSGTADKFKIDARTEGYYNFADLKTKTDYGLAQYTSSVSTDSQVSTGYALSRIEAIGADGATPPFANVTVRRNLNEAITSISNQYSPSVRSTMFLESSANSNYAEIRSDQIKLNGTLYNNDAPVALKPLKVSKNSVSALPTTISNYSITANMEVVNSVLSNPSAQTGDWTVTTSASSLTISGSISGTTNITLYLEEPRT